MYRIVTERTSASGGKETVVEENGQYYSFAGSEQQFITWLGNKSQKQSITPIYYMQTPSQQPTPISTPIQQKVETPIQPTTQNYLYTVKPTETIQVQPQAVTPKKENWFTNVMETLRLTPKKVETTYPRIVQVQENIQKSIASQSKTMTEGQPTGYNKGVIGALNPVQPISGAIAHPVQATKIAGLEVAEFGVGVAGSPFSTANLIGDVVQSVPKIVQNTPKVLKNPIESAKKVPSGLVSIGTAIVGGIEKRPIGFAGEVVGNVLTAKAIGAGIKSIASEETPVISGGTFTTKRISPDESVIVDVSKDITGTARIGKKGYSLSGESASIAIQQEKNVYAQVGASKFKITETTGIKPKTTEMGVLSEAKFKVSRTGSTGEGVFAPVTSEELKMPISPNIAKRKVGFTTEVKVTQGETGLIKQSGYIMGKEVPIVGITKSEEVLGIQRGKEYTGIFKSQFATEKSPYIRQFIEEPKITKVGVKYSPIVKTPKYEDYNWLKSEGGQITKQIPVVETKTITKTAPQISVSELSKTAVKQVYMQGVSRQASAIAKEIALGETGLSVGRTKYIDQVISMPKLNIPTTSYQPLVTKSIGISKEKTSSKSISSTKLTQEVPILNSPKTATTSLTKQISVQSRSPISREMPISITMPRMGVITSQEMKPITRQINAQRQIQSQVYKPVQIQEQTYKNPVPVSLPIISPTFEVPLMGLFQSAGKKSRKKSEKSKIDKGGYTYMPSLTAVLFDIKTNKIPRIITGLETRGLYTGKKVRIR